MNLPSPPGKTVTPVYVVVSLGSQFLVDASSLYVVAEVKFVLAVRGGRARCSDNRSFALLRRKTNRLLATDELIPNQ